MRQHIVVLDGLRGIAALCVLLLHAASIFGQPQPIHANLAVDFFFVLSGFVIAHAYDDRLKMGMTLGAFMKTRIIRLYPMILASVLLGAISAWPKISPLHLVGGILLLPTGLLTNSLAFPLNFVLWSLFFEVVASAIYGSGSARVGLCMLVFVCLANGLVLGVATIAAGEISHFGVKDPLHFAMGVPRILYPFCLGILLHRLRAAEFVPCIPAWTLLVGVGIVLLIPLGECGVYDAVVAIFVLPLVVMLGARATSESDATYRFLGDISYPLYAVHVPMLVMVGRFFNESSRAGALIGASCAVVTAWSLLKIYDEPVRKYLSSRRSRSPSHAPSA